jgi:hypothetical protein
VILPENWSPFFGIIFKACAKEQLLHGAKWIGVAHAQNGHRIYWAMVIGAK